MNTITLNIENELIAITHQFLTESGDEFGQRKVTPDASLQKHLGIDSLSRAELFSRIEKRFEIQFTQTTMAEANTIRDIEAAILTASPKLTHIKQNLILPSEPITNIDPSSAKTLIDILLLYAIQTPDKVHIYLQDEYGKEQTITFGKLLEKSLQVANAYIQRGLRPGDTIAIMLPTSAEFFYIFFGTLLAGCIPVPIYPPFRPHQIEAYAKQEAKILQNAEVRLLVTFHQAENLSRILRAFIPSLKSVTTASSILEMKEKAPIIQANPDDFALIQYTSGSTSVPKGVLLSHYNLLSNIRCFGKAAGVTSKDIAISWAPLYHDLGLIAMWLGSLYYGAPLTIMSPLTFLTRPERWLWAIHYHRGTISGGPNFAFELCARKIEPAQIEGLDLSSWRLAFNGAEAIQPKTLERFTKKFEPYGFKSETHYPVYGLAESCVCVAVSPLNRGPRIDVIERDALERDGKAIPSINTDPKTTLEFVASGKAIPEHALRIADEQGNTLPEREVGFIQFKGPSSLQGYYANPEATQAIFHDGWWDTGDIGYLSEEEVFITGRRKDMIIKAGRNLYPAEIEDLAAQVPEIRKGCVIAFGTSDPQRGTESLVVVAETRERNTDRRAAIIEHINENITNALDIAPDHIILVPPQTIPKTSSGKLQRNACRNSYLAGKLSKKNTATWVQFLKLGVSYASFKIKNIVNTALKIAYTAYIGALLCLTLPIVWSLLWITSRKIAAHICKAWAYSLTVLGFCPITIINKKNLYPPRSMIYVSNHVSYIDALFMLAILPAGTLLAGKSETLKTPIAGTFMKKLGYIPINRLDITKSLEETESMTRLIKGGQSIMLFPEGTFSYSLGLRPFKMGAFKLAADSNTPVCPIALYGTRFILRGEEKLLRPHRVKVVAGDAISPLSNEWQALVALKNKTREFIGEHCGEPTLDLIMSGIAETKAQHQ